jgi:hypothetical protein
VVIPRNGKSGSSPPECDGPVLVTGHSAWPKWATLGDHDMNQIKNCRSRFLFHVPGSCSGSGSGFSVRARFGSTHHQPFGGFARTRHNHQQNWRKGLGEPRRRLAERGQKLGAEQGGQAGYEQQNEAWRRSLPVSPASCSRRTPMPRTCVPSIVGPIQRVGKRRMAVAGSEHDSFDVFGTRKFDEPALLRAKRFGGPP